jgi:hypothetical protein
VSDEIPNDDRDEFIPWHERQPWMRGIGHVINAVELVSLEAVSKRL